MQGQLSQETLVAGWPASAVWDVYRGIDLIRLITELLTEVIGRVEVISDTGGVGTIVKRILPPGAPGPGYLLEKFTKIDDEKRVTTIEIIEGYKELGFRLFRKNFEIIEKGVHLTLVRTTIEYDLDDKFAANISYATTKPLESFAENVATYLAKKKNTRE